MEKPIHPRVAAALQQSGLAFRVHRHSDYAAAIRSPQEFASAIGYDLKRITKSLFVRCPAEGVYGMVVCSISEKVNFHAVAGQLGCKKAEVGRAQELAERVGYPPRGVSPLGLDGIAVLLDDSLFQLPSVLIGAGQESVEIEIAPGDLEQVTKAARLALTL